MLILSTWILAVSLAPPAPASGFPRRIDVDCQAAGALERALVRAKRLNEVDIYLHGVCEGHFVIDRDGVTFRGATAASGLAAPHADTSRLPVLEVIEAHATLRGLIVRGGEAGVLVRGWDAELLLVGVDVDGQSGPGVIASRGASAYVRDTAFHDGSIGIVAESDATLNLQNVIVRNQRVGVIVADDSAAAINDTTFADNREAGLSVYNRSDANVLGGVFRDNGEVHIAVSDRSDVNLLLEVTFGSETDTTPYALGATRSARIASFSTPVIHGDVSVLDGGSIRLGNTLLKGDLIVEQFADAYVRDASITGSVVCADGAEAICTRTITAGAVGCASSSCGTAPLGSSARAPKTLTFPSVELPRFTAAR